MWKIGHVLPFGLWHTLSGDRERRRWVQILNCLAPHLEGNTGSPVGITGRREHRFQGRRFVASVKLEASSEDMATRSLER
jgi:hypothetical protein